MENSHSLYTIEISVWSVYEVQMQKNWTFFSIMMNGSESTFQ